MDKPAIFRFGSFQFDSATGILSRGAYEIRLPTQAAKVLMILIEERGELVTRTSLCELLWPDVSVNEADQGINNIVSRLRNDLRDSSQKPRYIETIPKRGYRFLVPVEALANPPAEAPSEPDQLATSPRQDIAPPATSHRRFSRLHLRLAAAFAVLCVLLVLVWALQHFGTGHGTAQDVTTLAIAPFQVAGNDSEAAPLAESLRLDLTDSLSQLPGLQVRASNSVPSRATSGDRAALAAQLNVDLIVFVQLAKQGHQFELDMELMRAKGLTHIASWHYEGTSDRLRSILQQARDDVFSSVHGQKLSRPMHGGTDNAEAYEIYLRGRYHARQRLPESLKSAIGEFQQAIKLDPGFANAYAGLADASMASGDYSTDDRAHAYQQASDALKQALALDPTLADAHALLGYLLFRRDWRFAEGEAQLRQAIQLDNAKASYHLWLAIMLTNERRFDEAAREIEEAKKDDPFWAAVYGDEAYLEAYLHQFSKLNQTIDTLVNLKPDWSGSYDERAWAYWLSGHYEQAISEWRRMAVMDHDQERINFEDKGLTAFRSGGAKAYARLRYAASISGHLWAHADSDFQPAEWAAYMGDYSTTLHLLASMAAKHDISCLEISVNSAYIPLYDNPEYQKIVTQIGLPLPPHFRKQSKN